MEETYDGVIGVSAKVGIKEELSASLPLVLSKTTTNLKIIEGQAMVAVSDSGIGK